MTKKRDNAKKKWELDKQILLKEKLDELNIHLCTVNTLLDNERSKIESAILERGKLMEQREAVIHMLKSSPCVNVRERQSKRIRCKR